MFRRYVLPSLVGALLAFAVASAVVSTADASVLPSGTAAAVPSYNPTATFAMDDTGHVSVRATGYRQYNAFTWPITFNTITVTDTTTGARLSLVKFGTAVDTRNSAPYVPAGHGVRVVVDDWFSARGDFVYYTANGVTNR